MGKRPSVRLLALLVVAALAVPIGVPGSAGAIYEGEDALIGDFPWMAAIHQVPPGRNAQPVHICGGTLVDQSWVLTAMHCLEEGVSGSSRDRLLLASEIRVSVGADKQSDGTWNPDYMRRINLIVPFDPSLWPNGDFYQEEMPTDIALLRLEAPITGISPVQLASRGPADDDKLLAIGWGRVADDLEEREYPDQLQKIEVYKRPDSDCWEHGDSSLVSVAAAQICTKAKRSGFLWLKLGGPRKGDSGGPVLAQSNGQWSQVGVISHGPQYCDPDGPERCGFWDFIPGLESDGDPNLTGSMDVARLRDWIETTITEVGQTTLLGIVLRDQLIARQEALLNAYRCLFRIDTSVVPGGCVGRKPAQPIPEPGIFEGLPTQSEADKRDELVVDQESLLNTYRCLFGVDVQLVPYTCLPGGKPWVHLTRGPEGGPELCQGRGDCYFFEIRHNLGPGTHEIKCATKNYTVPNGPDPDNPEVWLIYDSSANPSRGCIYWHPGNIVYAVVDGVRSNDFHWSF